MSTAGVDDWDERVQQVWASAGDRTEADVLHAVERLASERLPGDPAALFERASAHDHVGLEAAAETLYRQALAAGLSCDRRAQAVIQLASTLRLLGRPAEAVDLLDREQAAAGADDLADARAAFLALALSDTGQERRALATALTALADHLPRYQRAVQHHAGELVPAHEPDAVDATPDAPTPDAPTPDDRPATATYEVTTDTDRIDLALVHRWLSPFWAVPRSPETVSRAANGSINFAAFASDGEQVAYARVVTDHATFAWLCDVYVDPAHRGRGLGSRLAGDVVAHLRPLGLARVMLTTVDAHDLYRRVGFETTRHPDRLMLLT